MKLFYPFVSVLFFFLFFSAGSLQKTEVFKIKDFYPGMSRADVIKIYEGLKEKKVAQYISMEKENYRDLIKLDNEFSNMGNKIEVAYDDDEKVQEITYQYKTVNILFDAAEMDASGFVEKFRKEYKIDKMEYKDMGFVKSWTYTDEERGLFISIDGSKNLRFKKFIKK